MPISRPNQGPLRPATNRFRVTQSMGDVLAFSGGLRRLAVEIDKVASDLRLLSSGPRAGLAEVRLPPVQPGILDHAGEGEPVGSRDGQSGLFPGVRLRCGDTRRLRMRVSSNSTS